MALSKGKIIAIIAVIAVVAIVLGSVIWYVGTYNSMVSEQERIDSQWAQVTNEYQRKIDLIPNLVATASQYQQFESATLTNITALRSRWMNATSTEEQVNLSNQLDAQIHTIVLTYEAYPTLQSVTLIQNLMFELTGTENRIAVERMRYNDDVQVYNAHIKAFPASVVAGQGGFREREYYQSPNAPVQP